MDATELRAQLEDDLSWRLDELRHLRNQLLGDLVQDEWPAVSLRTILVMQYAHLEGFSKVAFALYLDAINSRSLPIGSLQPSLMAAALAKEFKALQAGSSTDDEGTEDRLLRRARKQVAFLERLRGLNTATDLKVPEDAVSMEMNVGADIIKRTVFLLGMPEQTFDSRQLSSVEFVKNARNDIAHGSRRDRIPARMFDAHRVQCERFMADLSRTIARAVVEEWFSIGGAPG